MRSSVLLPDQLNTWSDTYAPQPAQAALVRFAKASAATVAPAATSRSLAPRFPHRAIQALRQAGMQMRPRSRSRPQVLRLHKLPRTAPANGLCAPGFSAAGHRGSRPLPSLSRVGGGDLRDQWRAPAPARVLVKEDHAQPEPIPLHSVRYSYGCPPPRQSAHRLAEERTRLVAYSRGQR
jgi:hypothetical protein